MLTCIKNVRILTPLVQKEGCVLVREDKIAEVCGSFDPPRDAAVIDGRGLFLSPGFIDLHVHGGGGKSVMSGSPEDVVAMCTAHAKYGTTSILPTTLAAPVPKLLRAVEGVRKAREECESCHILGVHLEGPFLSPKQSGAQNPENLLTPVQTDWRSLLDAWDGICMMGAAPEVPGVPELGRELRRRGIVASAAHTDATYDQMVQALDDGFCDITHLYSGCSTVVRKNGFRVPGVVEAGLELADYTVQVIADGKHLPDPLLRLIYQCKGADKIELITDGLEFSASELEEGASYRQENGMETVYEDGVMKLPDRQAFAGSVATSSRLVRTMKDAGIPLQDAVRMATLSPAKRLSIDNRTGRIAPGYDADIILFDGEIHVRFCMVSGKILVNELD